MTDAPAVAEAMADKRCRILDAGGMMSGEREGHGNGCGCATRYGYVKRET